jgi:hypothetical protein
MTLSPIGAGFTRMSRCQGFLVGGAKEAQGEILAFLDDHG